MINRCLSLEKILKRGHSAFLFGPRGVGKTVLAKAFLQTRPRSLQIDLLRTDLFSRYLNRPSVFRTEVEQELRQAETLTVLIDEVQKLPSLLDEVHHLLTVFPHRLQFVLTGSSARKLRRGGANLLAGRAWTLHLHPFTTREVNVELTRALQWGTLPAVHLDEEGAERTLRAYVETYLKEEIMQEALVRRLDGFVRFLDLAGQVNGEPVNFTKIADASQVTTKTAQEFFSILVDTLVAFRVNGWSHSVRKQLRQGPKYYWFDCGVLNAVRGELRTELKDRSFRYGRLFETWVILELIRLNDYTESEYRFFYWQTNTGMEVDVILSRAATDPPIAIEIKSSEAPQEKDVKALHAFRSEHPKATLMCLCRTPHPYHLGDVLVYPWRAGLETLFTSSP